VRFSLQRSPRHLVSDCLAAAYSSTLMCFEAAASDIANGRELAHGAFPAREIAQHPAPRGIAEGVKDGVHWWRLIVNHMV
jgi:hypothetical protein